MLGRPTDRDDVREVFAGFRSGLGFTQVVTSCVRVASGGCNPASCIRYGKRSTQQAATPHRHWSKDGKDHDGHRRGLDWRRHGSDYPRPEYPGSLQQRHLRRNRLEGHGGYLDGWGCRIGDRRGHSAHRGLNSSTRWGGLEVMPRQTGRVRSNRLTGRGKGRSVNRFWGGVALQRCDNRLVLKDGFSRWGSKCGSRGRFSAA